jgi:hypothetical protein
MKNQLLIIAALFLQGCGVYECIDTIIPRSVRPIDQPIAIEIEFNDQVMSMTVHCEEYYEAMCSERGNSWSVREVGLESYNETSKFQFTDTVLGIVEIPIPNCENVVRGKVTPLNHIVIRINGEPYWLTSSEGNTRILQSNRYANTAQKSVQVTWSMRVNGVLLI